MTRVRENLATVSSHVGISSRLHHPSRSQSSPPSIAPRAPRVFPPKLGPLGRPARRSTPSISPPAAGVLLSVMSLKQGLVGEGEGTSSSAYVPVAMAVQMQPVSGPAAAASLQTGAYAASGSSASPSIYGDVQMQAMYGPSAASLLTNASAASTSSASPSPFAQVNGQVRTCCYDLLCPR